MKKHTFSWPSGVKFLLKCHIRNYLLQRKFYVTGPKKVYLSCHDSPTASILKVHENDTWILVILELQIMTISPRISAIMISLKIIWKKVEEYLRLFETYGGI